jgi:hypothetical protein
MAGRTETDEVKLVKLYGGWKIDVKEVDKYGSAYAERATVQTAVASAMLMFNVSVGMLNSGGIVSRFACNVTYNNGTPLPIGDYIVGGIVTLAYIYSVDTDGKIHAINGPLAE